VYKKTSKLIKFLKDKNSYKVPSCHDPLTAKLIEKNGFKVLFIGGFALSSASLGYPDASIITQKELVDATRLICSQTKSPIIVDADTGFGGLSNVYKTVTDLEQAGASAVILEDQVFPKRCALTQKVRLLDFKKSEKRIKIAIKASKESNNILIFARTDALSVGSIKETIKRCKMFKKLGADAVFITGINTLREIKLIKQNLKRIPLIINITQDIKFNIEDIKKNDFKFILYSQQLLNSYIDTTNATLRLIKNNKNPKFKNKASDTLSLLNFKKYLSIENT
jgi:methylisocitrate lyase